MIRLWDNAWAEFIPFLDYDVEIRRVICSTNAIESLNARYRRAIRARGHFPSEQAALKCLYLVTRSLDPTGCRQGTMDDAVETCPECVRDHLRRSIPGSRNLLLKTAGNTVNEIVPASLSVDAAIVGGCGVEPAFAGPREDTLLGVAELVADLAQAQVGLHQEPVGDLAAGLIDQFGEGGVLSGQSPLQCFGV